MKFSLLFKAWVTFFQQFFSILFLWNFRIWRWICDHKLWLERVLGWGKSHKHKIQAASDSKSHLSRIFFLNKNLSRAHTLKLAHFYIAFFLLDTHESEKFFKNFSHIFRFLRILEQVWVAWSGRNPQNTALDENLGFSKSIQPNFGEANGNCLRCEKLCWEFSLLTFLKFGFVRQNEPSRRSWALTLTGDSLKLMQDPAISRKSW